MRRESQRKLLSVPQHHFAREQRRWPRGRAGRLGPVTRGMLGGKQHGAVPMTWFVKGKAPDGTVDSILCDEPRQVYENLKDQREKGREVWIEDTGGRRVEEQVFAQPTGGDK